MFDIYTILLAVWFGIIALIMTEIFVRVPYPRIRILLPLLSGVFLGLLILVSNPGLESGYRGQTEYLGPFCFPVLVPLFISVSLIFFWKEDRITKEKTPGFVGAIISSFLFLILYQSRFFFGFFQDFIASCLLIGSTLIISSVIFFIIERFWPALPGSRNESQFNNDQQRVKKNSQADLKQIGILVVCLLVFLSPLCLIDFFNNLDRATKGQLYLSLPDPYEAPGGTVIQITGEKMQEYPEILSLIQKPRMTESGDSLRTEKKDGNATSLGMVRISCNTEFRMRNEGLTKGSFSSSYFEYNGDLYKVTILHYAGEECARISFFS
ncbi:MAG: hypothetical protein M0Q91_17545 [Methanoregula sp.]|jgi:hypothetical protein|nr:hypothetical protein [Methanoregula sp.]